MAKTFHIGDIVSCGTGYLMPPNGVAGAAALLSYMTGDTLMVHQLPMAGDQMQPHLERQFPWLIGLTPPNLEGVADRKAALEAWLAELSTAHGEQHEVVPPSSSVWGEHDPIEDLREVAPHLKIIGVELPED